MSFHRTIQLLNRAENTILVWTILGLAAIGFVQVITRYIFNYSFTWYEELGRYLGVFITFLGASIGVKKGSHFTMGLFLTKLPPLPRKLLIIFNSLLCASFFLLVTWYSWKILSRMYGYGTTSPTMQIPMYIPYLPIPVFSSVMALRYGISAARDISDVVRGQNDEVAS